MYDNAVRKHGAGAGAGRIMLALLWGLTLSGCATAALGLMGQRPPVQESITLPMPPEQAYLHAATTLAQMGAANIQGNVHERILSSTVHGAVTLDVAVLREGQASRVYVTGRLLPGKLALGKLDEVDDYIALLQKDTH
jgi:hypothetical protein